LLTIERGLVAHERDFFRWDDALRGGTRSRRARSTWPALAVALPRARGKVVATVRARFNRAGSQLRKADQNCRIHPGLAAPVLHRRSPRSSLLIAPGRRPDWAHARSKPPHGGPVGGAWLGPAASGRYANRALRPRCAARHLRLGGYSRSQPSSRGPVLPRSIAGRDRSVIRQRLP
jgi:hypothetical protein